MELNDLKKDGTIACPYCSKGRAYLYGAKGMASHPCNVCGRMVLWDYDSSKAYRAKARRIG